MHTPTHTILGVIKRTWWFGQNREKEREREHIVRSACAVDGKNMDQPTTQRERTNNTTTLSWVEHTGGAGWAAERTNDDEVRQRCTYIADAALLGAWWWLANYAQAITTDYSQLWCSDWNHEHRYNSIQQPCLCSYCIHSTPQLRPYLTAETAHTESRAAQPPMPACLTACFVGCRHWLARARGTHSN